MKIKHLLKQFKFNTVIRIIFLNYIIILFMISLTISLTSCQKEIMVTVTTESDILSTIYLPKGSDYTIPTFDCEKGFYYIFDKTEEELNNLKKDLEIKATKIEMNKTCRYYQDNILLKEETIPYTSLSTEPILDNKVGTYHWDIEEKYSDHQYYYQYNLVYSLKTFTVSFYDQFNNLIEQSKVTYGEDATYPVLPDYQIVTWEGQINNITANTNIIGTITLKKYEVSFYNQANELINKQEVTYGSSAIEPLVPENMNVKWDKSFTDIKEDTIIYGTYLIKTFYVSFYDQFNNLIDMQEVKYGDNASSPKIDENYQVVWDKEFNNITSQLDVIGTLTKIKGTIKYYDGTTDLYLSPSTYQVGTKTILPTYEKDNYEFIGWFASDISLYCFKEINTDETADFILYARFSEIKKEPIILPESTYHFTDIKKTPHSSGTGVFVYQPVFPNGVETSVVKYNWSTSDIKIATVSQYSSITSKTPGYTILTASLKTDPSFTINCLIKVTSDGVFYSTESEANDFITYKVKFITQFNDFITEQIVPKGQTAFYPLPPVIDNYAFIGWDHEPYNIQDNLEIKALYKEGTNVYTNKKLALIGDSISTYQDYIPKGYACFYPYPTADVNDINQTWWMKLTNKLGAGMFINNSYSGSCVAAGGGSDSQNSDRINQLFINGISPDYVFIYMGSNDCASSYITPANFSKGYLIMIDKILKRDPNIKIILFTLPKSKLYSDERRIAFNEVITKIANDNDYKLITLDQVDISDYLVDSAHPNHAGMELVANYIYNKLQEENK